MKTAKAEPVTEVSAVVLTLDVETARAVRFLVGLGTIHFANTADDFARSSGLGGLGDVVGRVQLAHVGEALAGALRGRTVE